jgi:tetratricopeptide (TPR) repeat protein
MRTFSRKSSVAIPFSLLLCLLAGCSPVTKKDWAKMLSKATDKSDSSAAGDTKLKIAGQNLGESQEVAVSPAEFLANIEDLLQAERMMTATRWIARHPDAAQEALRQSGGKVNPAVLMTIARVHDRQTLRHTGNATWEKLLLQRKARPEIFTQYDQARIQLMTLTSHGEGDRALQLNLPSLAVKTGETMLEIDAWQLQGTVYLLIDKPADAVAVWQKALSKTQSISDYQTAYLLLLVSDAQRRAGDPQGAVTTWLEAVNISAGMLGNNRNVYDPVLWEKLAYMRPVKTDWPEPAIRRLREIDPLPGTELAGGAVLAEACLWNCVGKWYLDRGHHQAALVAFKRAESVLSDIRAQHYLRFREARSLVLLNQTGAATALLVGLANDRTSLMARPSMALLGSLRLKSGSVQQGFNLLRKAIEKDESLDWPERAEAEADLGLAYLMFGDEVQGLKWLHQAQQRFEGKQEFESLALAMHNEANYLAHAKKQAEAVALRDRLMAMERK